MISHLQAMQIEVSAVCNLKCTFCPTTYIKSAREPRFFPLELYKDLIPYFPNTNWVYLQGWGEPFLHPDLWTMVALAKKTGAKVGLTTNGSYFDDQNLARLFEGGASGLDLVSISIAGATSDTHNKIRVGSDLKAIFAAVRDLIEAKKQHKSALPIVKFSYMLTKQSIAELPAAVAAAADLGVDELYTTNLDYVFDARADQSKVFAYQEEPDPAHLKYISEAEKVARDRGFPFRSYPLHIKTELAVCDLNPNDFVYITANGDVTPCTYLGLPNNPRCFKGKATNVPKKVFGNLAEASFEEIWKRDDYVRFREPFAARKAAYDAMLSNWLYHISDFTKTRFAERKYRDALKNNPVSPECATCYKLYGA